MNTRSFHASNRLPSCSNCGSIKRALRVGRLLHPYFMLIAIMLLLAVQLQAEISQSLEGADSLNVGTPFTFKVKADYAIKQLSIPDTLKSFAIVKSEQSERSTREWEMTLVPLRVGALSFPRLQVQPSIPAYKAEYTDGFRVNVLSVLAEGDTLLRDIKPFEKYPWQPPFWLYLLLVLLALGLAIYLLTRRKKRKPQAQKAETKIPEKARPPWETALAELDALFAENLLEKGELILYHFRLSLILRAFLEAVHGFPALEMTTRELGSEMHKLQIPETGEIKRWLSYCDMVKFAKTIPSVEEIGYRSDWLKNYLLSYSRQQTGVNGA